MAHQVIFPKNEGTKQGSLPAVVQGSTLETITILALYKDGSSVDLSTMTVTATMTDRDNATTAVTGTLTGANGSFTWAYSAGDIGTAGRFSTIITYTDGVDSWSSEPVDFDVIANPAATAAQNSALVGVPVADALWLSTSADGGDLGTAAYEDATGISGTGATDGHVWTADGADGAAWAAVASNPSLSDYQNVIVVDAGGNGDYTSLSDAIAAAATTDQIYIFGDISGTTITITKTVNLYLQNKDDTVSVPFNVDTGGILNLSGAGLFSGNVQCLNTGQVKLFCARCAQVQPSSSGRLYSDHSEISTLTLDDTMTTSSRYIVNSSVLANLTYAQLQLASSSNRRISNSWITTILADVPTIAYRMTGCHVNALSGEATTPEAGNTSNTLAGVTWTP